MTLIVGMFYGNGTGALIISDSRSMLGPDYSRDRKVVELGNGIVFAASGYTGISEKLVQDVKEARIRARAWFRPEVVNVFEDEMAEIWRRYKGGSIPRFARDDHLLNGIIGFVDDGKPRLYCLHENGYAELVSRFRTIGDGSRHAHNIVQTLHHSLISKDEALKIGVHAIMQVSTIDAVVDAYPQIAVLEKDVGKHDVSILNYDGDGNFHFECSEIDEIKEQVASIEEKHTQTFRMLLEGSKPLVKKLDKVLGEYGDEQKRETSEAEKPSTSED